MSTLTIPYGASNGISSGLTAQSSQINANFTAIANLINGGLDNTNLSASVIGASGGSDLSSHIVDGTTLQLVSNQISIKTKGVSATQIADATITGTQISSNVHLAGTNPLINGKSVATATFDSSGTMSILRGRVAADGTGFSISGYTCSKLGTGHYQVVFGTAFSSTPSCMVIPDLLAAQGFCATLVNVLYNSFEYYTYDTQGGTLTDAQAHFIVIGTS